MKYLKHINLILLMAALFGSNAGAQTVDQIIEKHIKAHGGRKAWEAITSMKISGKFTSFSETHPFTEIKARPGNYYSTYHLGQFKVIDGKTGDYIWRDDPWFELGHPYQATQAEQNLIEQKAELCTPFFNYREKDFKVEFQGKEEVDGIEVFKLQLTRPNGNSETWFINTKTYLEYMCRSMWADFGSTSSAETIFEDFRKVGDVVLPFYIERVFSIRYRVTEIDKIELNREVNPNLFVPPLSEQMEKLRMLEGNWNVVLTVMSRGGGWVQADSTQSVIRFAPHKNLLKEELSFSNFFTIDMELSISYNSEIQKYMLAEFNDFSSDLTILSGSFSNDSLVFDNSTLNLSKEESRTSISRSIYSNITDDSFLLEIATSRDEGKTWNISQKFTYTRNE